MSLRAYRLISLATLLSLFTCAAIAQSSVATTVPPVVLDTMMVSGTQPGPGMWKVANGDHVLWIVGTHSPLPVKMNWRAKGVENIVSQAQEILGEPGVGISLKQLGYWTALTLLPNAFEVRKSPDSAVLKEIVPADLHRRWVVLRDQYVDGYNTEDNDIERWRPMFAARELFSGAIKQMDMSNANVVWPVIHAAAKKHNVKVTAMTLSPEINDARGAMREFHATRLDDLACFAKTIERVETDLDATRRRANAWATGDVDALRKLPESDQRAACDAAFRNASFLKKLNGQDLLAQVEKMWLDGVEKALTTNKVTLTALPITRLIAADGYLAKLKARGFVVAEPEQE